MTVTGDWNAMGARGTAGVPVTFDLVVDNNRVFRSRSARSRCRP